MTMAQVLQLVLYSVYQTETGEWIKSQWQL